MTAVTDDNCLVCVDERRAEIERAMIAGAGNEAIASRYGLNRKENTLGWHKVGAEQVRAHRAHLGEFESPTQRANRRRAEARAARRAAQAEEDPS